MKKLTLGEIIDGIKRRDNKTLARIYKELFPVVRYYVQNHGGSADDAQDVFQESIIIIYKQISDQTLDIKSGFEAYLYGIARLIWLKILRNREIHDKNADKFHDETVSYQNSDELIDEDIELRIFRKQFLKLGKECQEVLKMISDGISYEDIAKKMNYKSEKIVRNKRYKCKELLTRLIKSDPEYKNLKD